MHSLLEVILKTISVVKIMKSVFLIILEVAIFHIVYPNPALHHSTRENHAKEKAQIVLWLYAVLRGKFVLQCQMAGLYAEHK